MAACFQHSAHPTFVRGEFHVDRSPDGWPKRTTEVKKQNFGVSPFFDSFVSFGYLFWKPPEQIETVSMQMSPIVS
jgi:hypothetical protein